MSLVALNIGCWGPLYPPSVRGGGEGGVGVGGGGGHHGNVNKVIKLIQLVEKRRDGFLSAFGMRVN